MTLLHATTVAISGHGVLIRGPSGAGKSSVALNLIERGAMLVADDQTDLFAMGARVMARPPDRLAGWMEVRGLGLLRFPYQRAAPLSLVVDLIEEAGQDRVPDPKSCCLEGIGVALVHILPWTGSAPQHIEMALGLALRLRRRAGNNPGGT